jgi:hypothetical protein
MKYKIVQRQNSHDGSPMFDVYSARSDVDYGIIDGYSRMTGFGSEHEARAFIERQMHPVPEKIIAEIEG